MTNNSKVLTVNLRKVEEALKNPLLLYKINEARIPIPIWIEVAEIVSQYGMDWHTEDTFGSFLRSFHQQIYIENRECDIEFLYPQKGDLKTDKDGNPVEEHPPILDDEGDAVYDEEGNILYDTSKTFVVEYGEPELFFDVAGAGRISEYIPPNLPNRPAISQFYIELNEWREDDRKLAYDGVLQESGQAVIFQPDLSQYNEKLPKRWAEIFTKTNAIPNNVLRQNLILVPYKYGF